MNTQTILLSAVWCDVFEYFATSYFTPPLSFKPLKQMENKSNAGENKQVPQF